MVLDDARPISNVDRLSTNKFPLQLFYGNITRFFLLVEDVPTEGFRVCHHPIRGPRKTSAHRREFVVVVPSDVIDEIIRAENFIEHSSGIVSDVPVEMHIQRA